MKKILIGLLFLASLASADQQYIHYPTQGGGGGVTPNSCTTLQYAHAISNTGILSCSSPPGAAYTFSDSVVNTGGNVTLVGDTASPTASQYYGTNSGSTLGYYNLPTGGITQLTGDVTAGPGSGSQAATLATVNSNVGSFTNANITVNGKGLITAAANGSAGTSYTFADSLVNTAGTVTLVGDGVAGNSKFYGTDGLGNLGYYNQSAIGVQAVAAIDSVTPKNGDGLAIFAGQVSLQSADASNGGAVTTAGQVFSGAKEFSTSIQDDGVLTMQGASSGAVTIQTQSAAGTYNFNLPTTAGTSGQFLTTAGGGSSPMTWSTPAFGGLTLTTFGSSPTADAASGNGTAGSPLQLQPASASFGGGVSTGSQVFAGTKTFANLIDNGTLEFANNNSILDGNANAVLGFNAASSAIDYLIVSNSATAGHTPYIQAAGGDSSISIDLISKGSGITEFDSAAIKLGSTQPIQDVNGNNEISFTATAGGVNNVNIANSSTTNPPTISAVGSDTNISLYLAASGTGIVQTNSGYVSATSTLSGASITPNCAVANNFVVLSVSANTTINNPTNCLDGQRLSIRTTQNSTGGYTITWGSDYRAGVNGGALPTTFSGANLTDYYGFIWNANATKADYVGINPGGF